MNRVAIRSIESKKYLSLDGHGVDTTSGQGGGRAMPQSYVGSWETFIVHPLPDNAISFESSAFPDVYLRLAPLEVDPGKVCNNGGGVVNAQKGCFNYERFHLKPKEVPLTDQKGVLGIESVEFPGRFLRMHDDDVNVQGIMKDSEEFEIIMLP
jgi:hypothetical protein